MVGSGTGFKGEVFGSPHQYLSRFYIFSFKFLIHSGAEVNPPKNCQLGEASRRSKEVSNYLLPSQFHNPCLCSPSPFYFCHRLSEKNDNCLLPTGHHLCDPQFLSIGWSRPTHLTEKNVCGLFFVCLISLFRAWISGGSGTHISTNVMILIFLTVTLGDLV